MAAAALPKRQIFIRPRSEIITVLDWQQVSYDREEQDPSETCLDARFFQDDKPKTNSALICGSYEFTRDESEESEDERPERNFSLERQRSVLMINRKTDNFETKPRLVKAQSIAALPTRKQQNNSSELKLRYGNQGKEERSTMQRKKSSLDVSLAKLRHEMNSLRRQDMELLEQLLDLNNSIQDFKFSQWSLSESIWDCSDESESECEQTEIPPEKPFKTRRWHSRGSLGSDGSDYHSASSRSSSGSNHSLSGSDVASSDSGHESTCGRKSSMKPSRGKFGSADLRRVSFGQTKTRSGSELFDNGSSSLLPARGVRRNSVQFRVAELRPIQTLSKRQSTIW